MADPTPLKTRTINMPGTGYKTPTRNGALEHFYDSDAKSAGYRETLRVLASHWTATNYKSTRTKGLTAAEIYARRVAIAAANPDLYASYLDVDPEFTFQPQSILLNETETRHIGGGLLEFERTWLTKPLKFSVPEQISAAYQVFQDGQLTELPITVISRVESEWFVKVDPSSIEIKKAHRYFTLSGSSTIYQTGTPPAPGDTEILYEDSKLTQYGKGNLWRREARYVPTLNIYEVVT